MASFGWNFFQGLLRDHTTTPLKIHKPGTQNSDHIASAPRSNILLQATWN